MQRFYLPFLLLMILVFQGVALDFLPESLIADKWIIVPHWILIFLILISVFYDLESTYYSILYAILFGLMLDIVYTNVIGVYMFTYGIVTYAIHGIRKVLHTNYFVALLLGIVGVTAADIGIYIVYWFIGIHAMSWNLYLIDRLVPTIISNVIFLILLYPIVKPKLLKWSQGKFDRKQ
ncbi:rod shape-determining protein MreD [Aquibacillus kalidii]|uniref:rod shape-determining protein MreD n=1 Tax=Aquibacillus kalidii TaxID=2762597 RepID=UPI001647325E|nr:rod shape-determining protein MreD [Aquibacillus kalidii]